MIFPPVFFSPVLNKAMFVFYKTNDSKRNKRILNYFNALFHLIFPPLCSHCKKELLSNEKYICWCCDLEIQATFFEIQSNPSALDKLFWGRVKINQTFALFYFKKECVSQTILHEIKYGHKGGLGVEMGRKMARVIMGNYSTKTIDALIPVPTHHRKKFNRGYNQSEKLALGISEVTNIPIDTQYISKKNHTESQTKKSNAERWLNVIGGFGHVSSNKGYQHIAIVDDVITTGATLEALIKEIRKHNPNIEISIFALAMAKK